MAREGCGSVWQGEPKWWLAPFLDRVGQKAHERRSLIYVAGPIGFGDRKGIQRMAERLGLVLHDWRHRFVSGGSWDAAPLLKKLARKADGFLGAHNAVPVMDDIVPPKKGSAAALDNQVHCQTLILLRVVIGCHASCRP